MLPIDKLHTPGEHVFDFEGAAGKLEAIVTVPSVERTQYVAILGHPHSLQGGSMSNKVVTTMARAFRDLGILSLRFNFRGVGVSEGTYDAGVGESDDMLVLQKLWAKHNTCRFLFAGFSFGSYVAFRAASQCDHDLLISVAPPVHHYDFHEFPHASDNWAIIQGDEDEVVPVNQVLEFAGSFDPAIPVIRYAETSHFFHGKLLLLKDDIMRIVNQQVLNQ